MIAEIISTGDEILTGSVIDSNSSYIAQKLEEAGIKVVRHVCVGDDIDSITSVLMEAGERSDLAVITGGLGPTSDDITAEAAARASEVKLVFDRKAMDFITGSKYGSFTTPIRTAYRGRKTPTTYSFNFSLGFGSFSSRHIGPSTTGITPD